MCGKLMVVGEGQEVLLDTGVAAARRCETAEFRNQRVAQAESVKELYEKEEPLAGQSKT